MTTIIWKDGVFYADTQLSIMSDINDPSAVIVGTLSGHKLHNIRGHKYAGSGNTDIISEFLDISNRFFKLYWRLVKKEYIFNKKNNNVTILDFKAPKLKIWSINSIIIFKRIQIVWFSVKRYNTKNITWCTGGSGQDYAKNALNLGLTPTEAIQYASDRCEYTNHIVESA